MAQEWRQLKVRNPKAKLVCIDTAAHNTVQMYDRHDAMNIGGFSDQVFKTMNMFLKDELSEEHLVGVVDKIKLDG